MGCEKAFLHPLIFDILTHMHFRFVVVTLVIFASVMFFGVASIAQAQSVAERVSGRIVLDVEHNGEAWYVYPVNLKRYFLGRPTDAFAIMRFLGHGITNENLEKIPIQTEDREGDLEIRERLSGYILLQIEENGEAWYVFPRTLKRYYLGRPSDAFGIMKELGVGISSRNLETIPIGENLNVPLSGDQQHQGYTLTFDRGSFDIDVVRLKRSAFAMVTDTGDATDCEADCSAQPLAAYAAENSARHGIHGSYFCPPDYPSCADKINSFLPPFWNSALARMINEDALPFHSGPMIVRTSDGSLTYFHRTIDFGWTIADFEERTGKTVIAAAANYPSLVENGTVVVESEPLEDKMRLKATRGAFGYNGTSYILVIARSASIIDLAHIMKTLGAQNAMNLDGGGSAALYYNNAYVVGPGRRLPNAIVFPAKE